MKPVLTGLSWLVAVVFALGVPRAALAVDCPLEVKPGGGGDFTDIQAAVDHYRASHNDLGCTIEVGPGSYTSSVSVDGVNPGVTSEDQRLVIRGTRGPAGEYLSILNTGRRDAIRAINGRTYETSAQMMASSCRCASRPSTRATGRGCWRRSTR